MWYRNREFHAHENRMIELDGLAGEARAERDQADLLLKRSHEILQAASAHSASEEAAQPGETAGPAKEQPSEPSPSTEK
jgi:hypothetical protein